MPSVDAMTDRRHYAAPQKAVREEREPMPIGEFGGAPSLMGEGNLVLSTPMYWFYEMNHAALNPARAFADATRLFFKNPINPFSTTTMGKSIAAAAELFERSTRRYGRPEWRITATTVGGVRTPVHITVAWERPFCRLLHFERAIERTPHRPQPKMLIVAPMSGHYATLLRGTVEAFLPNHDVYITDWADARTVPLSEGHFDLDDYIDYVVSMLHLLGGNVHVIAVCQPSVPVLAAVAEMEAYDDPYVPRSMILMGGPIDTRVNPTAVNKLAEARGSDWFRRNVITKVPFPHPGFMRDVYPGFLQLHGFVSMNLDRHIEAHRNLFKHLVEGDGDSAQKHKEFYDEYLAVMDLAAEYYLQTVDTVFVRHALPKGEMTHRGRLIDTSKIKRVALMTVEGEHDDISGVGQTEAAHTLCVNIPASRKVHWLQPTVGHYGVFNGSRFRAEIAPRMSDFILSNEPSARTARKEKLPAGPESDAPSPRGAVQGNADKTTTKTNGATSRRVNEGAPQNGEAKAVRPTHGPGRA
jgi:poly(3-hydroxybutyrate) depolymerase